MQIRNLSGAVLKVQSVSQSVSRSKCKPKISTQVKMFILELLTNAISIIFIILGGIC